MGYMEDKFIILLSTNMLPMAVLGLLWILVAKLTLCDRLYIVSNEASLIGCFQWDNLCLWLHKSALVFYRCFKTSSRFLMNWLKSPVVTLYTLNIINRWLVSRSTAQNSKSFSLHLCEILILLKYRSLLIIIHVTLSVDFCGRSLIPLYSLIMWDAGGPVPPTDVQQYVVYAD